MASSSTLIVECRTDTARIQHAMTPVKMAAMTGSAAWMDPVASSRACRARSQSPQGSHSCNSLSTMAHALCISIATAKQSEVLAVNLKLWHSRSPTTPLTTHLRDPAGAALADLAAHQINSRLALRLLLLAHLDEHHLLCWIEQGEL